MSRARITELEAERDEYRTTCLQLDAERNKERTRAEQAEAEVARLKWMLDVTVRESMQCDTAEEYQSQLDARYEEGHHVES